MNRKIFKFSHKQWIEHKIFTFTHAASHPLWCLCCQHASKYQTRPDLATIFAGDSFPASWHVTPSVTFCDVSVTRVRPRVSVGHAPSLSEVSDLIMSPLLCCDRLYFLSFCLDTNYGNKHSPSPEAHKTLCHVTRVSPQQFSCLNQSEWMLESWRKSAIKLCYEELSPCLAPSPWSPGPGHDIRAMAGSRWRPCNTVITDQSLLPWCYALWSQTHGERGDSRERRPQTTQGARCSNNSISIVCRPGIVGASGERGVCPWERERSEWVSYPILFRLCSILQCAAVTHSVVTWQPCEQSGHGK